MANDVTSWWQARHPAPACTNPTEPWLFSWNDTMSFWPPSWKHEVIKNPALSTDAYLLEVQLCLTSSLSNLKWQSLKLLWRAPPAYKNNKITSDMGSVPDQKWPLKWVVWNGCVMAIKMGGLKKWWKSRYSASFTPISKFTVKTTNIREVSAYNMQLMNMWKCDKIRRRKMHKCILQFVSSAYVFFILPVICSAPPSVDAQRDNYLPVW